MYDNITTSKMTTCWDGMEGVPHLMPKEEI